MIQNPVWWQTALGCRCPRCGIGKLYAGILTVRPTCRHCGLDLRAHDSGDGPAALIILVLGAIIVGMAVWVEFKFTPPLWLHAIIWPLVTLPLTVLVMRPLKSAMIAQQYRHRASDSRL